ncbi:MAG: hypothetical protein ACYS8K_09010, partial [Planctomycetota bacterium]
MATIEVKDGNPVGAIQELLGSMLRQGLLSAVLVPQEIPSKKTVVPTLVRDPEKLDGVDPLAPVFGVNCARVLARMCLGLPAADAEGSAEEAEQPPETPEQQAEDAATEAEPAEDAAPETGEQPPAEVEQSDSEQAAPSEAESLEEPPQDGSPPIGVVLRPCEIRAFIELVKLQQASIDPFLIIGVDCWGTYSVQDYAEKVAA